MALLPAYSGMTETRIGPNNHSGDFLQQRD
jgi:hypothetical protein